MTQYTMENGSKQVVITQRADLSWALRLYANKGETATTKTATAKTPAGAERAARRLLEV